jgi:hypothetical protein
LEELTPHAARTDTVGKVRGTSVWSAGGGALHRRRTIAEPPKRFTTDLYQQKSDAVYQHVFDSCRAHGRGIYAQRRPEGRR